MSHLPRLHPDDLKELGGMLVEGITPDLKELLAKEVTVKKMQTLTVEDVAGILNIDSTSVIRYINKGLIKATRPGKNWIITQQSLNNYINGNK